MGCLQLYYLWTSGVSCVLWSVAISSLRKIWKCYLEKKVFYPDLKQMEIWQTDTGRGVTWRKDQSVLRPIRRNSPFILFLEINSKVTITDLAFWNKWLTQDSKPSLIQRGSSHPVQWNLVLWTLVLSLKAPYNPSLSLIIENK